eukprot:3623423-Prymnesium_polylepis.1
MAAAARGVLCIRPSRGSGPRARRADPPLVRGARVRARARPSPRPRSPAVQAEPSAPRAPGGGAAGTRARTRAAGWCETGRRASA